MAMKRTPPDQNECRPGVPLIPKPEDVPHGYNCYQPWLVDKLEREGHALTLTRFIEGITQPYVLAINAGWGQGKSLFLRMWRDDLVNKNKNCILFNAWESDYGDDPLVALMGAVSDYVIVLQPEDEGALKAKTMRLWRKGWGFVKTSPKHLIKGGIRYLATKGLNLADWAEDAEVAAQDIAPNNAEATSDGSTKCVVDALAETAEGMYVAYTLQRDAMQGFQKQLKAVAEALAVDGFPLVVMVDELDRCRPDYAVQLLERIKHLFAVPGVVFVLALEAKQLCRTIEALYGFERGTGARTYLRRFLDMEYSLPEPSLEAFAEHLCDQYNLTGLPGTELEDLTLHILFAQLAKAFGLGLRDMAQTAARTAAIARAYKTGNLETHLTLTLLILRLQAPSAYKEFRSKPKDWEGLLSALKSEQEITSTPLPLELRCFLQSAFTYWHMDSNQFYELLNTTCRKARKADWGEETKINQIICNVGRSLITDKVQDKQHLLDMVEFATQFNLPAMGDSSLPGLSLEARGTSENPDPPSP